jgi:hypothetical protein
MATQKAWAIYFKGDKKRASGIASWRRAMEVYDTRKRAMAAMNNEFKTFKYSPSEQKQFKIIPCTMSYDA